LALEHFPIGERRSGRPKLVTPLFLLVMLCTLVYFIAIGALQPTLPRFVKGPLGYGETAVGLAIGAFAFSAVVIRPFIGPIGDRRGRRLLIVVGAGIVALSTAGLAFADSLAVLVGLRLVTGLGEAAFYVGAASVINDLAPDERRGEAVSYFSLALYGGLTVGPVIGETVLDAASFDATWIVAAASSGMAMLLGFLVRETRPESEVAARRFRWLHPAGLLPGAVLATSILGLGGFASFVPLYALSIGLDGSRLVFVTFAGVVLLVRSFGARLPDILGAPRAARAALTCQTTGLMLMGLWQEPVGLFVGAGVFGLGQALSFPALMTIAVRGAPPSERSAVVATFTSFFDLSFGLGALTLGGVAEVFGYSGAFIVAGLVAFGGLGTMVLRSRIRSRRRGVAPEPESA
jgi:MFS family permease